MKNEIPEDYPGQLSNEDLLELIKQYSKRATIAGRSETYVTGPSYWKEMVELRQIEISNRIQNNLFIEIGKLTTQIELLKKDNRKSGRINHALSVLTIILAILTGYLGYITLDYSKTSGVTDAKWKSDQTELLKKSNHQLENIHNVISKISATAKDSTNEKSK